MLLHVIDISGSEERDPYSDFKIVNNELKKHGEKVENLPQIIVLNKIDLVSDPKQISNFKAKISRLKTKYEIVEISAVSNKSNGTTFKVVF